MEVLRKRREFVRLNKQAIRDFQRGFILQVLPNQATEDSVRIGFTATKRIGNAVVRNRVKRRMRALWRDILRDEKIPLSGYDFVLIAKAETATLPYQNLLESLHQSLRRGIYKANLKAQSNANPRANQ